MRLGWMGQLPTQKRRGSLRAMLVARHCRCSCVCITTTTHTHNQSWRGSSMQLQHSAQFTTHPKNCQLVQAATALQFLCLKLTG